MTDDANVRLYLNLLARCHIEHVKVARKLGDTDSQGFDATATAWGTAYLWGKAYLTGEHLTADDLGSPTWQIVTDLKLCPDCLGDVCGIDCPRIREKYGNPT